MNYRNAADGRWTAIGIVSFGSSNGCTSGYPDAFTRVSSYLDWIESIKTNVTLINSASSPISSPINYGLILIHLISINYIFNC
jgi:secreted trypsin-like serine protease